MFKQNKISIHDLWILLFGFFFYLGSSADVLAQEGRSVIETETSQGIYDDFEKSQHADVAIIENKEEEGNFSAHEESKSSTPKKPGETAIKNEGMSTLSFNLLLYVVDKFREDK